MHKRLTFNMRILFRKVIIFYSLVTYVNLGYVMLGLGLSYVSRWTFEEEPCRRCDPTRVSYECRKSVSEYT